MTIKSLSSMVLREVWQRSSCLFWPDEQRFRLKNATATTYPAPLSKIVI